MGMIHFNFRSQALERFTEVTIVYPTDEYSYFDEAASGSRHFMPGAKDHPVYTPGMKFQTVYLIHGGGDDHSLTYRYTNAERYAQQNHVMLVTPNIPNSFGVDTRYQVKYQTYLTEELPRVIQTLFASSPLREDNFIMGYAMGGNVALGTAIHRPDLYAACVDLSGGIGMTLRTETLKEELRGSHFRELFPIYNATFGKAEDIDGSDYDLYAMAKRHIDAEEEMPEFIIACGSEEFIRSRVEGDVEALRSLHCRVRYEVPEGYTHDFEMWDMCIRKALNEWLPLKRRAIL